MHAAGGWREEGTDLVRGASGALLLGVPLIFTNEVWELGSTTDPKRSLLVLVVTGAVLVALNRTSGFRDDADHRLRDAAVDAAEGLALGAVLATVLLLVIRQVEPGTPLPTAVATIAYETVPCAIGVGLARILLRDRDDDEEKSGARSDGLSGTLLDLGAAALGATVLALSIAPTQEVLQVAAAMTPPYLLGLVATSLVASYAIVFVAGFADQDARRAHKGVLQRPVSETVAAYLVSLAVALLMLGFFEVVDTRTPPDHLVALVVALGLPACIGGAAGRLAA